MAEVYKKSGSPFWQYDFTFRGERKRGTLVHDGDKVRWDTMKEKEAKRLADDFERAYAEKAKNEGKYLTLRQAVELHVGGLSDGTTRKHNERMARRLFGEAKSRKVDKPFSFSPDMMLHELDKAALKRWELARKAEGYSQNSRRTELSVLSAAYHTAKDAGFIVTEPLEFPLERVTSKLRWLTEEEEERFLAELDPRRGIMRSNTTAPYQIVGKVQEMQQDAYDLAIFLLDTGCRCSEVSSVPWSYIDTKNWQVINIYRSKVGNEGELAITPRLREVLQRRHAEVRGHFVFTKWSCNAGEQRERTDEARGYAPRALRSALDRAGCNLPHLVKDKGKATVHSLRDTFASRLAQNGVDIYSISKLLGHSKVTQTEKYAHLCQRKIAMLAGDVLAEVHARRRAAPPSPPDPTVVPFRTRTAA